MESNRNHRILRLSLLRHGKTDGGDRICGSTEVSLTSSGYEQMCASVSTIKGYDRIVSSPQSRCAGFALDLSERLRVPMALDARWREIHFGAWEGQRMAAVYASNPAAMQRFWSDPETYPPPGAEVLQAFCERIDAGLLHIVHMKSANKVLVVTHGGPIRYVLNRIREQPLSAILNTDVPHASRIDLEYRAISSPTAPEKPDTSSRIDWRCWQEQRR